MNHIGEIGGLEEHRWRRGEGNNDEHCPNLVDSCKCYWIWIVRVWITLRSTKAVAI